MRQEEGYDTDLHVSHSKINQSDQHTKQFQANFKQLNIITPLITTVFFHEKSNRYLTFRIFLENHQRQIWGNGQKQQSLWSCFQTLSIILSIYLTLVSFHQFTVVRNKQHISKQIMCKLFVQILTRTNINVLWTDPCCSVGPPDAVLSCEFRTEKDQNPRIERKKKGKAITFV